MAKYNLSEAEFEIMEYIWSKGEKLSFSDIMNFTNSKGHTWKKQTVQTFLTRLIEKGALEAERKDNKRYYYSVLRQEEYVSKWTKCLVKKEFGGTLKGFLSAFTGGRKLSEEEAKELHEFLDK